MKKIIIFFTIALVSVSVIYKFDIFAFENSFNKLESLLLNNCDFVQNGLKVEYKTDNNLEDEKDRLIKNLKNIVNSEVLINEEIIRCDYNNIKYEIILNRFDKTEVDIILINENGNKNLEYLKDIITKIINKKYEKERYFGFVKGKLNNIEVVDEILSNIKQSSIEYIELENGISIKGILESGDKINVGKLNYNTGEYLIIGTPIIFTTY